MKYSNTRQVHSIDAQQLGQTVYIYMHILYMHYSSESHHSSVNNSSTLLFFFPVRGPRELRPQAYIRLLLMDHIVFYTPLSFFLLLLLLLLLLNIHTHSMHINGIIIQHMTVSILIHQQQREKDERECCRCSHVAPDRTGPFLK